MNPASLLPGLPRETRILIIRLRSLGDIVLLTPALRLLKEWRNDLRVSVLIESRFRELLEGNSAVAEILEAPEQKGWRKAASTLHLLRKLRAQNFALCLNLHGGPSSALLTQFSGARRTAGFAHFRRQGIYDFAVPDARSILDQPSVHTAEHQAAALFWLGLPRTTVPKAELFVSEAAQRSWRKDKKRLAIGGDYVLLHPPALYRTKTWPAARFAEIGRYVEDELHLDAVYSCGPGEQGSLDTIERAARRPIRRIQAPGLAKLIAAISEAKLFVGNDSGPSHAAAALGRACVVIFGSSNVKVWHPWAGSAPETPDGRLQVVQNSYDCNPCPGDRCYRFADPECILSVTVDQVRAAINRAIQADQPG